mgnify:FL=1
MPFVKVMIHAVWGIKNRERILISGPRKFLLAHIKENAKSKEIFKAYQG